MEFSVRSWSAVAPGVASPAQWLAWSAVPALPEGELQLDVSSIPAMARRRLGRLAKMAVVVADDVLRQEALTDVPMVWASRYGDADKSLALLASQAADEPLSPTAFGLSVHNGLGAQHSILRGITSNAICIASSGAAPEAGVIEAMGLLGDGADAVLLVCYDEPLPGAYAALRESPAADFAWAVMLGRREAGSPGFVLRCTENADAVVEDAAVEALPHGLRVLRLLLHPAPSALVNRDAASGRSFQWERLDA